MRERRTQSRSKRRKRAESLSLAGLLNDVVTEVDDNGALAPETDVVTVQIVNHAPRTTANRTERLSVDLRASRAETTHQLVQLASTPLRDHAEGRIRHLFHVPRHFHRFDTDGVRHASLIPPTEDGGANIPILLPIVHHTGMREAHHAAHRRSSASVGGNLLTLVRGERLRNIGKQLDAVFTRRIRAGVVANERRLRASAGEAQRRIAHVVIDRAHDRVVRGLERTIGGVELGGSHSRFIIPEDGNRCKWGKQGKIKKFLSPIIILSTIAPHGMRSLGFPMYFHAPAERASSRSFRAASSASSRLSITTIVVMSSGAFPLLRPRFHTSSSFRQSRSPAGVRGGL